jgi:CheY-like chemotaxis protein
VVYGIVKAHGGSVDVESAQGSGTVFRLYLPLSLAPVATAPQETGRPAGHGTVLLVEDEEMLAEIGRAWLEEAGYEVLVASDGDAAVELFRGRGGSVGLVVCDMGLPKRGGREVFFALRELAPRVRVILVSGFIEPSERAELAQAGVAGFLEKPYREEQLLEVVTQVRALGDEPPA